MSAAGVEALYREHYNQAVRLAWLITGDHDAAHDIATDAFVSVTSHLLRIRDADKFWAYLRRAVSRRAIDVGRSNSRRATREQRVWHTGNRGVDTADTTAADLAHVAAAVRGLPPKQRAIVILRYWADLSERDIARTLGIPAGTVKSGLSRALDHLREELQ